MTEKPPSASSWPESARAAEQIRLELSAKLADEDTLHNMSAGTRAGATLFVAADERAAIDRLTRRDAKRWAGHERFELRDLLDLANPEDEVDIEGLAADGDWLWVLGSHARTRPKPKKGDDCIDLVLLADLKDTRSRCVLARLPLVRDGKGIATPLREDGERRAGMLRQGKKGNALAKMLAADPLIAPFTAIPAKEGGVDVEGIAVAGDRIGLGMRGPVICTFALLIEVRWAAKRSGRLHLKGGLIKRLLHLEGLGIRDLKRRGDDLLILAGPTTGLDGPCALYRWRGWGKDPGDDVDEVELHRPEKLLDLPFGHLCDHPEGLALWEDDRILVLYDSPGDHRVDAKRHAITADLFDLPE